MKQKLQILCVALLALVLCNTPLFAHDFEVDGIYYNITSSTDKTVTVTYRGSNEYSYSDEYSGAVTIPESVTYSGSTYSVTSIGDYAFYFCASLTSVVIPNSVTSIGYSAFYGCSSLTSVEISNSVTSIGSGAFFGCSSLTSVVIPNSVTSIGDYAFYFCASLTSVEIPNSVTSIGDYAFEDCSSLTSVVILNSVTSIGSYAFSRCSNLTSVEIGNSVTSIGGYAFYNCSSLTSVEIPNSVTSIVEHVFDGCSGLTSVEIPNSVTSIGTSAFEYCSGLTSVEIPNSVTSIGETAFRNCSSLTSVVIPNSVTSIGYQTFDGCSSLTSVEIPNSVTSIWSGAFSGCSSLTAIAVAEDNPTYDSRNNCNAIIETQTNTLIAGCSETTIPNSVTSIGASAFYECSSLTSVVIPNSVTSIGDFAFYECSSLTSVVIPNSVTSIGSSAFSGCTSLTSVEIPNSVTRIGYSAFEYCSSLTSVEIPNSVIRIGSYAFSGCSDLKTVTVGCSWKTNPLYDFGENVTVNATLHSYENGRCTVCGEEESGEITPECIELVEGNDFTNGITREVAQVTYNRTLPNLEWNALYLPVEIPVAALSENYDLAYFNNMHAYDRNNDGTVEEMDMEVFLINEGTLHANYPYFIRAKSEDAKQLQLVLTDVVLHAAEETSLTCSSVFIDFALTGVYARNDAETLSGCYAINTSGAWSPIAAGSYLNPFRCYLKMTARDGSPVKVDEALKSIRIRVHGEDGTTDIDNMTINGQQPTVIYDLQGRRVVNPAKGIYIVNGKKVMIK